MRVIVDNSAGGDSQFADEVVSGLRERGIEVELRPSRGATFDTAVHLVDAGTVIRVCEPPDRAALGACTCARRSPVYAHPGCPPR